MEKTKQNRNAATPAETWPKTGVATLFSNVPGRYQSREGISLREEGLISPELQYEGDCFLVLQVLREVPVTVSTPQT
jgi:hypothetical protein